MQKCAWDLNIYGVIKNMWNTSFFISSIMFGIGLAMDAFSVSVANGLNEPKMKHRKQLLIAGIFAVFQFAMPLLGWFCVHNLARVFKVFERFIPFIALGLLLFIGGKMLVEGMRGEEEEKCDQCGLLCFSALIIQGIATSIDALSVGFTTVDYNFLMALVSAVIIAVVTFFICMGGLLLGKLIGSRFLGGSSIFGGCILIFIGIKIFIEGVFIK